MADPPGWRTTTTLIKLRADDDSSIPETTLHRDMNTSLAYAMLLGCAALLALLVVGLIYPAPAEIMAAPHPDYPSMLRSGTASPGGPWTLRAGYLTGLLVIFLMTVTSMVGIRSDDRRGQRLMITASLVYAATFIAMAVSYSNYVEHGFTGTILGFPPPTAWMLYGMWHIPWLMVFVYVLPWDSVSFPPESQERFDALLREKREAE